jgi:flagellar hook assembly protein FlgD
MDIHGIETRHDTIKVKLNFKKQFTVFSNPTNPEIQMVLNLDANSHIQIDIYNILGHLVESIFQGETQSGEHSISWDGSKFSSGYYLVTLRINDHLASSQGITILK